MKTLVLLTLVSVALAAPALQEEATEYHQNLQFPAHRFLESVKRERKSPTELKSSTLLHSSVPNTRIHTDEDIPIQTGRSFALKTPVIVKKKTGYHLYRDSEEEKAYADSREHCGRQVKVKLCDEDGKFRKMLRSSGHEISDSTSKNDMKHSIMMAREAIENLQRDFKRIEQNSASGKLDSKSDTDLHEDLEVTRQALEDIHKNYENLETMSLRASPLMDSDAMQNLHIRLANTEDERMALWKTAIENIYKNVEIAQNFEDSFKTRANQEKLINLHQSETASLKDGHKIIEKNSQIGLGEDDMRDMQSDNLKLHPTENINNVEQGSDKTFGHAREAQETVGDIAPSSSEVIEMKAVEIANHNSLRSENHKRLEPVKNSEWEVKEHEEKLNRNAEENLEEPLTDVHNVVSSTGTFVMDGSQKHEKKMAITDLDEKTKELHSAEVLEGNDIKNEITEEKLTTTARTTENAKNMSEDHHTEANEDINEDSKKFHHQNFDEQSENSMKAADSSDQVALNDLHLEGKHHNIDDNESEHTATLTEMKTAESHLHPVESTYLNAETNHETKLLSSMKTAELSNIPLNDIREETKHHNIDYNESEHTATLTEMKTAESNMNHQVTVLNTLGAVEDTLHHALSDHETRPSLKTADPSDQVPLNDLHLPHKHHNIDYNESEHTPTLTEMKAAENKFNHHGTILKTLEAEEDNLHQAVSEPLNSQWGHETKHMTSLKTADPSTQAHLNDFHFLHKHHNIDYNESEHTATITEMKAAENNFNHHGTVLKTLEAVEDNVHHMVSDPLNSQWDHETRPIISSKTADPSDQVPLSDFHSTHKHHNIDYNESEHTETLTEVKAAENKHNHHDTVPKTLEAVEDNIHHVVSDPLNSHRDHEARPIMSLKTANPSDQVPLKDPHLPHKYHNIDYNKSEHTATLAKMKTAEEPFNALRNHETDALSSLKTVEPLNQVHLNIDENESEHMKTLTQMKTSEDHIHPVQVTYNINEANDHHMLHTKFITPDPQMGHESRQTSVMKSAQPLHQEALNTVHIDHKHNNIDRNKLEQTASLTDLKSAEDHLRHHWTALREMKTVEDHFHHPDSLSSNMHWNQESHPSTSLKMANPTNQLAQDHHALQHKHQNMHHNDWEQSAKLTELKSAEDHLSSQWTAFRGMNTVEDHLHRPESLSSNMHWNQNSHALSSMKTANPINQMALDHLPLQRKHQNIDHIVSEHTAKLTDLKTPEDQVHQHLTATEMKHADNNFHHQQSVPPTHWTHESRPLTKTVEDSRKNRHELGQTRYSNVADHHFNHNNAGHGHDFDSSEHVHQHANFPHRFHHNIVHPDIHDMNVHDGLHSHFHPSLRDAMESLESEHVFRWKPSHESFRSSYATNPINPINSGGAVGVFPNANTGGCGIPLLLSCSPSVVSGSLAKAHGTSYSAPSYSAPSYRTEENFGFHNKRDTKKTNEIRNNNVLRSPTIVKQKTKASLDS
ncbi:unnamed protein product [Arctia plantaginis]|uniref:Uncharacterized protein n=1 Tax=Arctia plantaginis TaxID=874455 RepID=A0A8S1BEE8_ARCPL|nr:unnamed protein product [Arctia plantaginis]